ncbi:hypothetical protein D3C74_342410 [compost metagenome]
MTESPNEIHGSVGSLTIESPYYNNFLIKLYEFFLSKKMHLSEPTFSLSSNLDGLLKSLFNTYVGEKYFPTVSKDKNVKSIVRKIFEDRHFLDIKVKQDIGINPLPDLPVKINIDFGFKNGVWNYMQATPSMNNPSKNTEWFAKTKFLIENVGEDAKIYLMYRKSVLSEKNETIKMIKYFNSENDLVVGMDLDDHFVVENLCSKIENEANELIHVS